MYKKCILSFLFLVLKCTFDWFLLPPLVLERVLGANQIIGSQTQCRRDMVHDAFQRTDGEVGPGGP